MWIAQIDMATPHPLLVGPATLFAAAYEVCRLRIVDDDHVFVERLWRAVKYEDIYLHGYETAWELDRGLASYFEFYRYERLHMALGYQTPWEVYSAEHQPRRAK